MNAAGGSAEGCVRGLRASAGGRPDSAGIGRSRGRGRWRSLGGDALKHRPSSRVVCRLPSELPVAREESLRDGCWGGERGRQGV